MRTQGIYVALMTILLSPHVLAQWVQTSIPGSSRWGMGFAAKGGEILVGTYGIYRSTDNGSTWSVANTGLADTNVTTLLFAGSDLFAATTCRGIFLSIDEGSNWTSINSDLVDSTVFGLASIGNTIFAATDMHGIFRTTDRGASWKDVNAGLVNPRGNVLQSNGKMLVAGMGTGGMGGVFVSTDLGLSWTSAGLGLKSINSLAVNGDTLFASIHNGTLYRSTDIGVTWTNPPAAIANQYVTSLTVSGTNVFAASSYGGVFLSKDNGLSWNPVNTGLTNLHIYGLGASGSHLYAESNDGRIWRRPLEQMITLVDHLLSDSPHTFLLHENYPNPFNPSTAIRYGLPLKSAVHLTVFNTLGQQVAVLQNGEQEAGYHEVKFDASKLASGVYLYRMQAGSYVETKKLVIVR
jgi:photosystem II stability/assembly factor-like uncharacterized protein